MLRASFNTRAGTQTLSLPVSGLRRPATKPTGWPVRASQHLENKMSSTIVCSPMGVPLRPL